MMIKIARFLCVVCLLVPAFSYLAAQATPKTQPPIRGAITNPHVGFLAKDIVAGISHTCALMMDNTVKCWGGNSYGQVGDGTTTNKAIATDVAGLPANVSSITAGGYHTCAILNNGVILCWGSNNYGQLGSNLESYVTSPKQMSGLPAPAKSIAAGKDHTCALLHDASVYCWGKNNRGQIGVPYDNTSASNQTPLVKVQNVTNAITVKAGSEHTCAILANKTASCWGANESAQLGDGTRIDRFTPKVIDTLSQVIDISPALHHTCALLGDRRVQCWGFNDIGQLGNGTQNISAVPISIATLSKDITALSGIHNHHCIILAKSVMCWGENLFGQLGDGTYTNSPIPTVVSTINNVIAVAAGYFHTCAVLDLAQDNVRCWGDNAFGQLGNGATPNIALPRDVSRMTTDINLISAGASHTCALSNNRNVFCWGVNQFGELGIGLVSSSNAPSTAINFDSDIAQLVASDGFTCALTENNVLHCWGSNLYGELGNDNDDLALTPIVVQGIEGTVIAFALGASHACAATNTQSVYCWGNNLHKQLANNTLEFSRIPIEIAKFDSNIKTIVAGDDHTCVLTENGRVLCWGRNNVGQTGRDGNNEEAVPTQVNGLGDNIVGLVAGGAHTCGIKTDGSVLCWGDNQYGQLGDNTAITSVSPKRVVGLSAPVVAMSAGKSHTCAILQTSELVCWGLNSAGQLGSGALQNKTHPTLVAGLESNVKAVEAGAGHTCAITTNGRAKCWGNNLGGQLGIESASRQNTPSVVLATILPSLYVNYKTGSAGSGFTLIGSGFSAGNIALVVNNTEIATAIMALPMGDFVVFLDTAQTSEGNYLIEAKPLNGGASASTRIELNSRFAKRQQEGGGLLIKIPQNIAKLVFYAYVPMLLKGL
jgi:alpha-tubulin suppressor-like RCC1 family protein